MWNIQFIYAPQNDWSEVMFARKKLIKECNEISLPASKVLPRKHVLKTTWIDHMIMSNSFRTIIDTNCMALGITEEYQQQVHSLEMGQ